MKMIQFVSKGHAKSLGIALILISTSFAGSMYAQPTTNEDTNTELPLDVREQLEKQAAAMAAIYLEYTYACARAGYAEFISTCFNANRFYRRTQRTRGKGKGLICEDAFDGEIFYFGEPEVLGGVMEPARLGKYLVNDETDPDHWRRLFEFPYLDGASFYAPVSIAEVKAFSSIEPLLLRYLKENDSTKVKKVGENLQVTVRITDPEVVRAQKVDLDRQRQLLEAGPNSSEAVAKQIEHLKVLQDMTPKRTVKFVLDPKRGYGVIERENWNAVGHRTVRIQSDKWKYYKPEGIWLPSRCDILYYEDASDKVRTKFTCELKQIEFSPRTNVQFALDYRKAGTLIRDRTTPEARTNTYHEVTYTVAADGMLLRDAAADVMREINRRRIAPFWIGLNVLILGPIIIALYMRHKRKMKKG